MKTVAVTRPLFDEELARLQSSFTVRQWDSELPPGRDELMSLLEGCDGALTLLTDRIDGALLDHLPKVKVVSNLAVGFDNIDLEAATKRRVAICTTPDVLTDSTAEFAIALMFAVARMVGPGQDAARDGEWRTWYPMKFLGKDLRGSTIGIVGLGRIGVRVAELAAAIGMNVIASDTMAPDTGQFERVSIDALLKRADVISIHVPLTNETRNLIDSAELSQMKDDAILINTARGAVINTDALVSTLRDGQLLGVGLDVTEPEPLPANHALFGFPNVLITPHIASATDATRREMTRLAVENLIAALNGEEPIQCLNPEVLSYG